VVVAAVAVATAAVAWAAAVATAEVASEEAASMVAVWAVAASMVVWLADSAMVVSAAVSFVVAMAAGFIIAIATSTASHFLAMTTMTTTPTIRTAIGIGIAEFARQISAAADGVVASERDLENIEQTPNVIAALLMVPVPRCLVGDSAVI
jgi:hypothetical protein